MKYLGTLIAVGDIQSCLDPQGHAGEERRA